MSLGPDGFPAEAFRHLRCLLGLVAGMFTRILETGEIPRMLLRLCLIPLDKPGKPPSRSSPKRPISLIGAPAKILETVVLNRLLPGVENKLSEYQYANRRARGAEMRHLELYDFTSQSVCEGKLVYLSSLDIEGAFDTVHMHYW